MSEIPGWETLTGKMRRALERLPYSKSDRSLSLEVGSVDTNYIARLKSKHPTFAVAYKVRRRSGETDTDTGSVYQLGLRQMRRLMENEGDVDEKRAKIQIEAFKAVAGVHKVMEPGRKAPLRSARRADPIGGDEGDGGYEDGASDDDNATLAFKEPLNGAGPGR